MVPSVLLEGVGMEAELVKGLFALATLMLPFFAQGLCFLFKVSDRNLFLRKAGLFEELYKEVHHSHWAYGDQFTNYRSKIRSVFSTKNYALMKASEQIEYWIPVTTKAQFYLGAAAGIFGATLGYIDFANVPNYSNLPGMDVGIDPAIFFTAGVTSTTIHALPTKLVSLRKKTRKQLEDFYKLKHHFEEQIFSELAEAYMILVRNELPNPSDSSRP